MLGPKHVHKLYDEHIEKVHTLSVWALLVIDIIVESKRLCFESSPVRSQ